MISVAEPAIRAAIRPGDRLSTFDQNKPFLIEDMNDEGIVVLIAEKHRTPISWHVLEGALAFAGKRFGTRIGGGYTVNGDPATLDGFLKQYVNRAVAGWVAVILESAGLVRINRDRPATVRVTADTAEKLKGRG